jgi:hypothetical protein
MAGALAGGGRFGGEGVDFLEQVAVAVEEAAVDPGCVGDPGRVDFGALGEGAVERGDDALAAACGVSVAAVEHRLGLCAQRGGDGGVHGLVGSAHAVASEVVVVSGAGAAARRVGMPRETVWAAR